MSSGAAEVGHDDHARAGAGEVARDVDVRAVHAQHELGAGRDGRADLVGIEGVDADAHAGADQLAHDVAERRETASPGVQPMSMTSAPDCAEVVGRAAQRLARQPRRVVDLGDDLDVPGAVVARRRGAAEVARDLAQVLRSLLHRHADSSRTITCGSPSHRPGISTRSVPSPAAVEWRAIHAVVISAATVIPSTATSYANGGAISASTRRSAGSASRPVTNSTRRGAAVRSRHRLDGARIIRAGRRSARTCSACPSSAPPSAGRHSATSSMLARQREILVGDAAGAVRRQLDRHAAPRHRQIGMVIRRLGEDSRSRSPASASSASRRSCRRGGSSRPRRYQPGSACSCSAICASS